MGGPRSGRGTFFGTGFGNMKQININDGGTWPGDLFGWEADTLNTSVLMVREPGPEELFSGLDSDTLNKSVLRVGEPGPGRGNFFFPLSVI